MTGTEILARRIYLQHLIRCIERGPKFTQLPPAHFWRTNPHADERGVGRAAVYGRGDFVVARRKWQLLTDPEPVPTRRFEEKVYVFRDPTSSAFRRREATRIARIIAESKSAEKES